jgi:hypothetical protein
MRLQMAPFCFEDLRTEAQLQTQKALGADSFTEVHLWPGNDAITLHRIARRCRQRRTLVYNPTHGHLFASIALPDQHEYTKKPVIHTYIITRRDMSVHNHLYCGISLIAYSPNLRSKMLRSKGTFRLINRLTIFKRQFGKLTWAGNSIG